MICSLFGLIIHLVGTQFLAERVMQQKTPCSNYHYHRIFHDQFVHERLKTKHIKRPLISLEQNTTWMKWVPLDELQSLIFIITRYTPWENSPSCLYKYLTPMLTHCRRLGCRTRSWVWFWQPPISPPRWSRCPPPCLLWS